jgi:LacI family transcriptional regulator
MGRERAGTGVQVWRSRPTMLDVAREAGVALKTVSRVVNGEPGVRPATEERVRRAIGRLRYRRNDLARRLRSHAPTATLGLVTGDVGRPFAAALARGVEDAVRDLGWLLVMGSTDGDADRERWLVTALIEHQVDGLLVAPAGPDQRYLLPELRRGTPAVFLGRPAGGLETDTVVLDERGGARAGVAGVLAAGRCRLAFVGDASADPTAERLAGSRDALAGAGLEWDQDLARLNAVGTSAGEQAAAALLAAAEPPTALVALSGTHAPGVARALARARRQVTLLAFDGFDAAGWPFPVVVVEHDAAEMGRRAAELLLDRLDGSAEPARRVTLRPRVTWHLPGG